jgi:hypothetical protein
MALQQLGIERISLFQSGGNQPISEFLDPENPEMQIWIQYTCPDLYPGLVKSTILFSMVMILHNVPALRQFAGADITLRTQSGTMIQYFRLRAGFDKHAGGELTRVNVSPDGLQAEKYGTVMIENFLVKIDPEELLCQEIEEAMKTHDQSLEPQKVLKEIHASIQGNEDRGKVRELVRIGRFVVYSSGRYIIRNSGEISKRELSKNFFGSYLR